MTRCPTCLTEVSTHDAAFCDQCGTPLPSVSADDDTAPAIQSLAPTEHVPRTRPSEPQAVPVVRRPALEMRAVTLSPEDRPVDIPVREADWAVWSGVHLLPDKLHVSGRDWLCVDQIDLADRGGERRDDFEVLGADLAVREEGDGRYPGGEAVSGKGLRHQGGTAVVVLRHLRRAVPVVVLRRALALGRETAVVRVVGREVATIAENEVDPACVWRNRVFALPADAVGTETVVVEVSDLGSDPGLTWFYIWAYQPVGG